MDEKRRLAELDKADYTQPPSTPPPQRQPSYSGAPPQRQPPRADGPYTDLYNDEPVHRQDRGLPGQSDGYQTGRYDTAPSGYSPYPAVQAGPSSQLHQNASTVTSLPPPYQQPNVPQEPAFASSTHVASNPEGVKLEPGSYIEVEDAPAMLDCPHCKQPIISQIKTKSGTKTVVAAVAITLVFWPLAFVPFVSSRFKKKIHICPHCKKNLGKIVTVTAIKPAQAGGAGAVKA
ncbi:hypothetical protein GQ54DRAFT_303659 [Martensiomyces pterosporus]|nr:hypothetical protein GQ54DRAFT_303659 [Martensiomyces pterosporus]